MNSQILKAEKREIRTRWGHLALPYISKHFSWRSLMLLLEIVTANFGNHSNKAATSSRQNFCNVCYQPVPPLAHPSLKAAIDIRAWSLRINSHT
jgi:hypothetical protein